MMPLMINLMHLKIYVDCYNTKYIYIYKEMVLFLLLLYILYIQHVRDKREYINRIF